MLVDNHKIQRRQWHHLCNTFIPHAHFTYHQYFVSLYKRNIRETSLKYFRYLLLYCFEKLFNFFDVFFSYETWFVIEILFSFKMFCLTPIFQFVIKMMKLKIFVIHTTWHSTNYLMYDIISCELWCYEINHAIY